MEFITVELPYGDKHLEIRVTQANLMGVLYPEEPAEDLAHLDEVKILH